MVKVAVIGAGFSGLASVYYLLQRGAKVTLFEKGEIGQNTSSSASGLLHPFPGFAARVSLFEKEGREKTKELLLAASKESDKPLFCDQPLLRVMLNQEQEERFLALSKLRGDVKKAVRVPEMIKPGTSVYEITSGMTIYSQQYILALYQCILKRGAKREKIHIKELSSLQDFDHIVLATGFESGLFLQKEGFQCIKGQALIVRRSLDTSILGKGYLAKTEDTNICHLGSTYEHAFDTVLPEEKIAKELILTQAKQYLEGEFNVIGVKAGVRYTKKSSYLPFVSRLSDRVSIITAMGSRGLLYHAFSADLLAESIVRGDFDLIPLQLKS